MAEEYVEIVPMGEMKSFSKQSKKRKFGRAILMAFPKAAKAIYQYEKPRFGPQIGRFVLGAGSYALEFEKLLVELRKRQAQAMVSGKEKKETPAQYMKRLNDFTKAIEATKAKIAQEKMKLSEEERMNLEKQRMELGKVV